jgi:hypothetical protein
LIQDPHFRNRVATAGNALAKQFGMDAFLARITAAVLPFF